MKNILSNKVIEEQTVTTMGAGYRLPITMEEYDAIRAKYPPIIRINVGFILLGNWDFDKVPVAQRPLTKQMLIDIGLPEAALTKEERDALEGGA
ncbi:hypothetical protein [Bacillus phage phiAGATE]|uniref:Uncharacterized protein n=1 Tax=Bacillus phage phiAGATE TaxID=1204533 RepID=L0LBW5_9CAUD|nr:hypothetical protein G380_gp140 [Bacillus phage phiAGATE]AGB62586.1 hypothetical protein [Bacillus phage phiAGATE]